MNIDLQAREITPLRQTYAHVAQYIGGDKAASRYQEATLGAQPMANFHYRPTWDPGHELFDAARSKIVLADWYVLRDPRQYYYAPYVTSRAAMARTRTSTAGRLFPTTIRPEVSLSSRCTMPARGSPAASAWCASSPLSKVPDQLPGAGCTTSPGGL